MPGPTLRLLKSGKFLQGGDLQSYLRDNLGPHIKRAGLQIVKTEMAATPVKSGHLRRGWAIGSLEWRGEVLKVQVGNAVIYARRVNATSKKNAGYVDRGREDGRDEAVNIIKAGLKQALKGLWKAT